MIATFVSLSTYFRSFHNSFVQYFPNLLCRYGKPICKPMAYLTHVTITCMLIIVPFLRWLLSYLQSIITSPWLPTLFTFLNTNSSNFCLVWSLSFSLSRAHVSLSFWVFPIQRNPDRFSLFLEISTSSQVGACPLVCPLSRRFHHHICCLRAH